LVRQLRQINGFIRVLTIPFPDKIQKGDIASFRLLLSQEFRFVAEPFGATPGKGKNRLFAACETLGPAVLVFFQQN
jgi:hypothetical protein